MPQTMLAVLAVMMCSLFAERQQEPVFVSQNSMIHQAGSAMHHHAVECLDAIGLKGHTQALGDTESSMSSGRSSSSSTPFYPVLDLPFEDACDLAVSEAPDASRSKSRLCDTA